MLKQAKKKILSISAITLVSAVAIVTPISVVYTRHYSLSKTNNTLNSINKINNLTETNTILDKFSTNWNNNNKNSKTINDIFDSYLEDNMDNNDNSSYASLLIVNQKQNINKLSSVLKKLSVLQQNQVKNAMLKMYTLVHGKSINSSNYVSILMNFTTKSNINLVTKTLDDSKKLNSNISKDNKSHFLAFPTSLWVDESNETIQQFANSLNSDSISLGTLSVAAALLAAAEYISAIWDFGASLPWAIADAALGGCAATYDLSSATLVNFANESLVQKTYTVLRYVSDIGTIDSSLYTILTVTEATDATISATSWADAANLLILTALFTITSIVAGMSIGQVY